MCLHYETFSTLECRSAALRVTFSTNKNMKYFKTIAIFQYPAEYAVLQLLFEQEEIRYFFMNETMISVFPFYSNAFGGIHLKVHVEDVEEAEEIIKNLDRPSNLKIV